MKAAKTQKNFKEMPAKTNTPIPQTSLERLKLTIDQTRKKQLKNEAWTTSRGNMKSIFDS